MSNLIRKINRDLLLRAIGTFRHPIAGIHIISSHFAAKEQPTYEYYCNFLKFLKLHFDFIRIEEAIDLIAQRTITTEHLLSFTYDDGLNECYTIIAPALEEFKTNCAFFINGGYINDTEEFRKTFKNKRAFFKNRTSLKWNEIKDLHARGHIIGSHTLDHINLNSRNFGFVEYQILENKHLIEECIKKPCEFFAYPYGQLQHINNETLSIAEKYHKYIFSGSNYNNYFSFNGRVINRRHLESYWPESHIKFFLSMKRKF